MSPKLNRRRAMFVLTKIDEILAWERQKEAERDTRFVELGRYLCEVRAGQYWRVENVKSFDEFLERRFPESRRKAYYLMSIHEHLPPQARKELKEVGWTKGLELAKIARRILAQNGCHYSLRRPPQQFCQRHVKTIDSGAMEKSSGHIPPRPLPVEVSRRKQREHPCPAISAAAPRLIQFATKFSF
jgi:hypothetical protein